MKPNEHDDVEEHLPKKGWLGLWMKFTGNLEICPRFRFFSACSAVGAAVNNKVWIQRGDEGLLPKLFPNPWVMLLAPPGRGHKTTAINMAVNCLTEACDDVRILADKLTPEYLVKALSSPSTPKEMIRIGPRDATGLIKASELSVFFGKQTYNVGLVSLVTDLYDYREKWSGGTIGRGGETLRRNCISILGGSTPEWLQQMLPQDAFTGGFMSRFIIVEMPSTYFKKITHPKRPKDVEWKDLVQGLAEFNAFEGIMKWGNGSEVAYDKCYEDVLPTGDAQRDAYREREAEQILKLSMLLALNEERMAITGTDVKQAANLTNSLQLETNPRIDRLTTHPRMQLTQDIQDILKVKEVMSEQDLLKKVYKSLSQGEKQFYEALSVLRRTGIIEVVGKVPNHGYKLRKEVKL